MKKIRKDFETLQRTCKHTNICDERTLQNIGDKLKKTNTIQTKQEKI